MEAPKAVVSERHENINMLSDLLEKVREYDGMVANAQRKKAEIADVDRQLKIPKKRPRLLWCIIAIFAATVVFLLSHELLILAAPIVIVIIAGVIIHRNNKAYKERQEALHAQRAKLQAEYEAMCEAIQKYKTEVLDPSIAEYVPERFPRRYAYSASAIQYMLDAMIDLRADTIKEVINIYENDSKLHYMMNCLDNISYYSQATAKSTARAARAQEQTAANTAVTAANTARMSASMQDIARSQRRQADAARDVANAARDQANAAQSEANSVSNAMNRW